jgi:type II secretory pathway component PulL
VRGHVMCARVSVGKRVRKRPRTSPLALLQQSAAVCSNQRSRRAQWRQYLYAVAAVLVRSGGSTCTQWRQLARQAWPRRQSLQSQAGRATPFSVYLGGLVVAGPAVCL